MSTADSSWNVLKADFAHAVRPVAVVLLAALILMGCSGPAARKKAPVQPAKPDISAPEQGEPEAVKPELGKTALPQPDLTAEDAPAGAIWLDTLDLSKIDQQWGTPQAGRSVDGNPLTLSGRIYPHGIGSHAFSEMIIDLKGAARSFHAVVGVDDESETLGSVVFIVEVDGREVHRTGVLRGSDTPEQIAVDLSGARRLALLVEDAGDSIHNDHADWAGALLMMAAGAGKRPESIKIPPEPPPRIAKSTSTKPAIHAPRITGATPVRPFLFRIPATGAEPLRYAAEGLPAGLELNPQTGIITGALVAEGTTEVKVTVTGPRGQATSTLTIVGGTHSLTLTPPMGWNSWNVWGTSVDDAKVRAAADLMVASGLAAHGYQYIIIDDAWEGKRDADGRIQPNEKFPDMKALADYVHGKGLKLGIYSSPGPQTCAGYEGSYEHEQLDAWTYAEWGIDLLKYDWCSYGKLAADYSQAELRKPYELMRLALDDCGRDIVYSICQYGMGHVPSWGAEVGGNYWRTTGDIVDMWFSMAGIGFGQAGLEEYAGPGHWNDPDMLVVGKVGWGPELHDTLLTPNEQLTHVTLWSLLAAPLLIGCDLSQLDEFTLALLTNPEVLEVNQDPLGRQASPVAVQGHQEIWARPLADGALAVGLFNRGRGKATITASWADLGISGPQQVRNLWLQQDVGTFDAAYSATVPRHGVVMLKIRPAGD
ncbi:MAG: NPCBM/NEW2 domain-containing protein [Phycisphaerae bacterium]|nr:NPCBM/NEW2 domain-containing protein [Phycisphaerae bacterium]